MGKQIQVHSTVLVLVSQSTQLLSWESWIICKWKACCSSPYLEAAQACNTSV